ncbi:GRIP and coiled-coil domain-containing protein 1 [Eumeta japonica]|uniref:GRIP and coiled-coil domain-containing protein 1 n=1 Tax=Eumeta variegata TaxID=151549 RepID=A0A4C1V545_EUMVA|nr:GRIP and coiled-coil domain-containing protein 1 [Eumeta japonica]
MESYSKQELISTINKQGEQLKRYETRLRDVVTAYKGLVKEKEALEVSLQVLNKAKDEKNVVDESMAALTLSLSTLSAEKSRMEEAFQADKKLNKEKYEKIIMEIREEMKNLNHQHQTEINNLKAKIAYEIQERERERADYAAMLKELHLKLHQEKKTKEILEDKFAISSDTQAANIEMEKRVRDLSGELEAAQRKLQRAEARTVETPQMLVRLQEKMALLQQTHSIAIREEQIKAKRAEEAARKICARQEERVSILEAKIAELSQTIGEYDLRRRKDQQVIQNLKDSMNAQILDKTAADTETNINDISQCSETDNDKLADSEYLQNLIDKIHVLKKELIVENEKLGSPIDLLTILTLEGYENVHRKCQEEIENLKIEYETYRRQSLQSNDDVAVSGAQREIGKLLLEIANLKENIEVYKSLYEEEKASKLEISKNYEEKLKIEVEYNKEVNTDLKNRILMLEKQIQVQRDRYSALLDETDNYIRTKNNHSRKVSDEDGHMKENFNMMPDMSAPPHMLHYAHELARKDLDISQLRKDKHELEGQLRDCQRDATIEKERYKEVVLTLKQEIDRLRRIQSREGANLEYLKNVVLAYLMSTDYAGRKHMLNAIAAVLHFTKSEKNMILSSL